MIHVSSSGPLQSPRFQGQLWVKMTQDERPVCGRVHDALVPWRRALASGKCPALEIEVVQEERAKGSLKDLKTAIQKAAAKLKTPLHHLPRLRPNRERTQVGINYGQNEALRTRLKKELTQLGVVFFDTEDNFPADLKPPAFQTNDKFTTLAGRVGKQLLDMKMKITTAESCTGGLISSRLTDVRASGSFIQWGDVVYCNDVKKLALGVSKDFLDQHGPYNEETARQMANGSKTRSGADVSVSITGLAGNQPDGIVPAGTAYVGIAGLTPETQIFKVKLPADIPKERKKWLFSEFALFQTERLLKAFRAEKEKAAATSPSA